MYVLNPDDFSGCDTNRVAQFVDFWEHYYDSKNESVYFANLNLGNDLTEDNIKLLLRWKDARWLTDLRKDGTPNSHVTRVLEKIASINSFRNDNLTREDFGEVTRTIFPNGIVWRPLLFHFARPAEYPIADQHVFRAYSMLFGVTEPGTVNNYYAYAKRFNELAATLQSAVGIDDSDLKAVVRSNKRLDNALMKFGQFLATYKRKFNSLKP